MKKPAMRIRFAIHLRGIPGIERMAARPNAGCRGFLGQTTGHWIALSCLFVGIALPVDGGGQESRVALDPKMVTNESTVGDPAGLVDEQRLIIGPPVGEPTTGWNINSKHNKTYPYSSYLDLGTEKPLSKLWLFDTHNHGDVIISVGQPGEWRKIATYDCRKYMAWVSIPLDVRTRYVRLTRTTAGAQFTEIAIYEYSPAAWTALQEQKAAKAKAESERQAAMAARTASGVATSADRAAALRSTVTGRRDHLCQLEREKWLL